MDLIEAKKILDASFPGQNVLVRQPINGRGAYCIFKPNLADGTEEILGRNFDLTKALQQACLPILEKAREDHLANERAKVALFQQFGLFLQERFKDEFEAWLEAKEKPE